MSRKGFRIAMAVVAAVIAALAGLNLGVKEPERWDVSYRMANAKISWEQTFFPGAWSE